MAGETDDFACALLVCCFQVATSKMNLSEECDLEDYINRSERVSAADIAAICAEAGLHAVRANRYVRWAIVRDAVRAWTFFSAHLHVSVCSFACFAAQLRHHAEGL